MKLNIVLEIEGSDELIAANRIEKELIGFFQSRLKLTGIPKKNITVRDVELTEYIAVADCDFPMELVNCLHYNNIIYLNDLSRYTFSYVYELTESVKKGAGYICLISEEMDKYGYTYKDTDIKSITPISECEFTPYTASALERHGYYYLQQIAALTREQMSMTPNIGKKSLEEIEEKLAVFGLRFSEREQPEKFMIRGESLKNLIY